MKNNDSGDNKTSNPKDPNSDGHEIYVTIGVIFSLALLAAFITTTAITWDDSKTMGLNEWGDTIAGFGGCIALIWIVIGYHQNSKALMLQQRELKEQIKEIKGLRESSEKQYDLHEKIHEANVIATAENLKPILIFRKAEPAINAISFPFTNLGGNASILAHGCSDENPSGNIGTRIIPPDFIATNSSGYFSFQIDGQHIKKLSVDFFIEYRDVSGFKGTLSYQLKDGKVRLTG